MKVIRQPCSQPKLMPVYLSAPQRRNPDTFHTKASLTSPYTTETIPSKAKGPSPESFPPRIFNKGTSPYTPDTSSNVFNRRTCPNILEALSSPAFDSYYSKFPVDRSFDALYHQETLNNIYTPSYSAKERNHKSLDIF